ncbi:MAG: shikimate kinase [Calditrichia bacterium]
MSGRNITKYRRVVIIGFRGSGKSTIAELLANELRWPVFSTDKKVENLLGMSIPEIVRRKGWSAFREAEKQVISGLDDAGETVIDCGGGVVLSPENMEHLQPQSLLVWTDAPLPVLINRLSRDASRPLLSESDADADARLHYHERLPLYHRYSRLRVDTSRTAPAEICRKIISRLQTA